MTEVIDKIVIAASKMHINGIVHGDFKWVNILITRDKEVYFIDLDQLKCYETPFIKGIYKDLTRFHRFALEMEAEDLSVKHFFPKYLMNMPAAVTSRINLNKIYNDAKKDWIQKGCRKL